MRSPITDAVADVLNEHDVDAARALLANAIFTATDTELATRVSVSRGRPDAVLRIHGDRFRPAEQQLPCAADVRNHPLFRYRAQTGDRRPARLEDVARAGWPIDEATLHIFERLQISANQADIIVSGGGEYEGWTLVAPEPISRFQMRPLAEHESLLNGLDRHIELLAQVWAHAPAETDAGAATLTPRERVVLHLIYADCTAASIGARLGVSPRTVHKHQENIYRKLGARDRLGAVLVAQRTGLLAAPRASADAAFAGERSRI